MKRLLGLLLSLSITPPAVAAHKVLEGTYEIHIVDHQDGTSETLESLVDRQTNKRIRLKNSRSRKFVSGDQVVITGNVEADQMNVDSIESSPDAENFGALNVGENVVEKQVMSVIVDFADAPSHMSATALVPVLENTGRLMNEMSFGKIQVSNDKDEDGAPDIYRVKIPDSVSAAGCSADTYTRWRNNAIIALNQQGVYTSGNTNLVLYLPETVPCTWAGVATVGSLRTRNLMTSWVKKESLPSPRVTTHELGHNFGLRHAGKDVDNNGILENDYTDASCFMSSYLRGANGPHMIELGAFEDHGHSVKEMVTREGEFWLNASDLNPATTTRPHVLKVIKKLISATDRHYYYLSYKRGVGMYDTNLSSSYRAGVSIHAQKTPGGETYFIKTLAPGEEFRDDANSIIIRMLEKSADGSMVRIWVRQVNQACTISAPTLTTSVVEMNNNSSQTSVLTIKNTDSTACKTSLFTLASTPSTADLTTTLVPEVSLAPGQSLNLNLGIKANHNFGNHSVSIKTREYLEGALTRTLILPVTVKEVVPTSPTSPSISVTSGNLTLKWRASTSPSISGYGIYRKLFNSTTFTLMGTVSGLSFTQTLPTQRAAYHVKAIDLAGMTSTPSSEVVYTPPTSVGTPTNLTATASSGNLTLSWLVPSSTVAISHYIVYRRNYNVTDYSEIGRTTTGTHTEILPAVKVYYKVRAVDVYGKTSSLSDWESYTPPTTLKAASNLSFTLTASSLSLGWSAADSSAGVDRYQVYRKLFSSSSYSLINTTTGLSFTEALPTAKVSYYVRVFDVYSNYKTSSTLTYTPDTRLTAPGQVTHLVLRPDITIKWAASTATVAIKKYEVFRKLSTSSTFYLKSSGTALSYTETLPTTNSATYYVKATDIYDNTAVSATTTYTADTQLTAPSGLVLTAASPNLNLKWNPSTATVGIQKYEIHRKLFGQASYQLMSSTTSLSFTEALPAAQANYFVRAFDTYGNSKSSTVVTYTPDTRLTAPGQVTHSVTRPDITINWTAASATVAIQKYEVYRKLSTSSTYYLKSTGTTLSYTETLPTTNSAVYYVKATDVYGNSVMSATTTYTADTKLTAPTGLSLSNTSSNITLNWSAATATVGIQKYEVHRKLYGQTAYQLMGSTAAVSFTETLPTAQSTYFVKAIDAYGNSKSSTTVTFTPDTRLTPASNLTLSALKPDLTLKWAASIATVAIQKYEVYRKLSTSSSYSRVSTGTTLSYTEILPTTSTANYYVRSFDVYGNSSTSAIITYSKLTAPTGLTITVVKPNLTLKWVASTGTVAVQKYEVYRKLSTSSSYTLQGTVTTSSYTQTLPTTTSATYYVKAWDADGNSKTSPTMTYYK